MYIESNAFKAKRLSPGIEKQGRGFSLFLMAKPGPRPIPTKLKKLTGNPGKRPLPKNEPVPNQATRLPPAPAHLTDMGKKEWQRAGKLLHNLGLLTDIDLTALAGYCSTYAQWVDAQEHINKHGVLIKAPSGYPVQSPYLGIANRAMVEMRKWLVEFGMTPSSRTRIQVEKPKEKSRLQGMMDKKIRLVK